MMRRLVGDAGYGDVIWVYILMLVGMLVGIFLGVVALFHAGRAIFRVNYRQNGQRPFAPQAAVQPNGETAIVPASSTCLRRPPPPSKRQRVALAVFVLAVTLSVAGLIADHETRKQDESNRGKDIDELVTGKFREVEQGCVVINVTHRATSLLWEWSDDPLQNWRRDAAEQKRGSRTDDDWQHQCWDVYSLVFRLIGEAAYTASYTSRDEEHYRDGCPDTSCTCEQTTAAYYSALSMEEDKCATPSAASHCSTMRCWEDIGGCRRVRCWVPTATIEERDAFRCNNTQCVKLFDPLHEAEWSLRDRSNSDALPLVMAGLFLAVLSAGACCCVTANERRGRRKEAQAALSAPQGETSPTAAVPAPAPVAVPEAAPAAPSASRCAERHRFQPQLVWGV
jgi:hypothetical protein